MRRWQSHKVVEAEKIARVEFLSHNDACILHFEDGTEPPKHVPDSYAEKHHPKAGGYYVKYADGYESFSQADAFETGYTEIPS